MTRGRAASLAVALVVAVLTSTTAARADDDDDRPVTQKMRFVEKGGVLRVSTKITQIFDSAAYEALGSGFESTLLVRMWLYRKGEAEPVAFQMIQRKAIYDMWDEVYEVRLEGGGVRARTKKVKYRAEALKLLTSIDSVPIATVDDVPVDTNHVLVVVAELNPVSDETLAEVRRWLTEGNGGGLDRGGSLFGAMVSVFVNPKIAGADRVVRLKSQPFYRESEDEAATARDDREAP
ncbi:MAG: hypothetical protein KC464_09735 [Myxococcales bacterium]|nr:hypothetical protein [Myxococcales bacterium]